MSAIAQAHKSATVRSRPATAASRTGAWLLRGTLALAALLLAVPVILLPFTTAVPAPVWLLLFAAGIALIVLPFRLLAVWPATSVMLVGFIVVSLLAVAASQSFAATPPITDANGQAVPNSIATLEKVNLNGTEQWITIRGKNVDNPVLLYLGMGGPGGGGFATRGLFEPLEDDFVVVAWDEPGTGKSYNAVDIKTLTPQRFVDDAHALTELLRERFGEEKIYVYGVSWTSILGVWLVQQYPDLYYAYVGNGQMVNTTENDVLGYELALDYLTEGGNTALAERLRRNGPPPYDGADMLGKYVAYLDVLNDYMGAPRYTVVVPIIPMFAPEYGYIDKINHTRGLVESFQVVYPQLRDLDFTTQAARLEVPVYFLAGRHDVNAMSSLVERYYNGLQAPHKELLWLEAGHGLNAENLDQFVDIMVNNVLQDTYPGAAHATTY
jgi:pimeloyl-ACP methyl ester carboxylesterase